jgi:hypothetical protein
VPVHPQYSRRDLLKTGYGVGVVAMMQVSSMTQGMKGRTFVLVHPAWHGGWFWKKLVPLLRAKGHVAVTPTLTGLGERSHLARPDIGHGVHVTDVVNALTYENLRDVILIGHSSSGAVIPASPIARPSESPTSCIWMPLCPKPVKACWIWWRPKDAR